MTGDSRVTSDLLGRFQKAPLFHMHMAKPVLLAGKKDLGGLRGCREKEETVSWLVLCPPPPEWIS